MGKAKPGPKPKTDEEEDFDFETLGGRVKGTRKELGLTQQDLAAAAGISTAAISSIEAGYTKNLKNENLFALADLMKVNPRWLAIGKGPRFMKAAILALFAVTTALGPVREGLASVLQKTNVHSIVRQVIDYNTDCMRKLAARFSVIFGIVALR